MWHKVTHQLPRTVFYLDSDRLERIKREPHLAWHSFQSTRLDVFAPRIDNSQIKLDGSPDLDNRWHVDFIPCYTPQHFCALVKIDSTNIVSKDRAYQNGGGFALLLAVSKEGNKDTDEFTVFGICPFEEKESLRWSRFFVYYRDVSLVFSKSDEAEIVVEKDQTHTHVLVMIPWKLAEPLTPFIAKEIGLNFWAAQSIDAEIPVQMHMLLRSERLISENQLRDYELYELENPQPPRDEFETTCLLESKHFSSGTRGRVFLGLNSPREGRLAARLLVDSEQKTSTETAITRGINRITLEFPTEGMAVGEHELQLDVKGGNLVYSKRANISIYSMDQISEMEDSIRRLKEREAPSMEIAESIVTLEYLLEASTNELKRLKPYTPFDRIRESLNRISEGIRKVESNESLFVRGKPIRMGLRSRQDATLQPYSIYIPNNFKPDSGGLAIVLHGSGTDDRAVFSKASSVSRYEKTNMIAAAPFARGESHYYVPKVSVEEIAELTERLMKVFSIPKERVVLSGFSMGGFGVLNTYFHKPDLFRNLVVVSGGFHLKPFLNEPDWSTDEALGKLATTNLIIFHGDSDLNMPYEQQKAIHAKLKHLNPKIQILIGKGIGHQEAPDWEEKMAEYLTRIIAKAT